VRERLAYNFSISAGGTLKAVHFDGSVFSLTDTPTPAPAQGEALIRVKEAGICATDLEIAHGYMSYVGVPGHEFVGVVEQSASGGLAGRRVVGEINCPCGSCDFCRRGLGRHCPNRTVLGISGRAGCFAEYLTLPEANLHLLPESLSDFQGVMVEPVAAAYRIIEQIGPLAGMSVAVLGDGKLGLLVAQAVASDGAQVCLIGRHPERGRIVLQRGIEFVEFASTRSSQLIRAFPVAVDCTGSADGPSLAMDLLEPAGTLVVKSTVHRRLRLSPEHLVVDEINIVGSRCGPFKRAIRALQLGEVDVDPLLERSFPLERAVEALEYAARPGVLKVTMTVC
jgi:threonine dehydrogenase-like Zn-dependent dehydrogenase